MAELPVAAIALIESDKVPKNAKLFDLEEGGWPKTPASSLRVRGPATRQTPKRSASCT